MKSCCSLVGTKRPNGSVRYGLDVPNCRPALDVVTAGNADTNMSALDSSNMVTAEEAFTGL
ncbi:hypothetical protein OZX74_04970 [Bifidobacterium sp. ESL0798]|uniref:hypothetical protein n=1 Tax=Bifidobacterium sp. ESL0798 TaxID=2983235 RepID=UPI0023F77604|nr:hypothetical protein [Bifidobacterium sp. ESL0798]WEV73314.1 hypothetical protein OZX74_04970 [Bifidobacterium sp. ESL0798]